jgi:hypothetical protein
MDVSRAEEEVSSPKEAGTRQIQTSYINFCWNERNSESWHIAIMLTRQIVGDSAIGGYCAIDALL